MSHPHRQTRHAAREVVGVAVYREQVAGVVRGWGAGAGSVKAYDRCVPFSYQPIEIGMKVRSLVPKRLSTLHDFNQICACLVVLVVHLRHRRQ